MSTEVQCQALLALNEKLNLFPQVKEIPLRRWAEGPHFNTYPHYIMRTPSGNHYESDSTNSGDGSAPVKKLIITEVSGYVRGAYPELNIPIFDPECGEITEVYLQHSTPWEDVS